MIVLFIPVQTYPANIAERIFYVRNQKIMFDFEFAEMYGVETDALKQVEKRNTNNISKDCMFILNMNEVKKGYHKM